MRRPSDRALLTIWRTGMAGFGALWFREIVFLGGLGALNGRIENGRTFIGGHGEFREVAPWLFRLIAGYEMAAVLWFVVGMIAFAVFKARPSAREWRGLF